MQRVRQVLAEEGIRLEIDTDVEIYCRDKFHDQVRTVTTPTRYRHDGGSGGESWQSFGWDWPARGEDEMIGPDLAPIDKYADEAPDGSYVRNKVECSCGLTLEMKHDGMRERIESVLDKLADNQVRSIDFQRLLDLAPKMR